MTIASRYITVLERELHYTEWGRGNDKTIVMWHGLARTGRDFDDIAAALTRGRPGEVYNLGGGNERTNLEVVRALLQLAGKPESLVTYVADRPGHDRRYALDSAKAARDLGWRPRVAFDQGFAETVAWYRANVAWCDRTRTGGWREWFEQQYGQRLAGAGR